jgi:hypothetical protein
MTRFGRFALLLVSGATAMACQSKSTLLTPRDGGGGSGGGGAGGSVGGRDGGGAGGPVGGGGVGGASDASDASADGLTDQLDASMEASDDGAPSCDAAGDGACGVITQCDDPTFADCTAAPGCETMLGTDTNCAGCGDRSCAIANTLFSCRSANGCTSAPCAVGYANCDRASPDCEAIISAGAASCAPTYLGSVKYVTIRYGSAAAAIATDGSFFFGGVFTGTVSFGTPAAPDVRMTAAGDVDGFITKFDADGSYVWTRTFTNSGGVDIYGREAPMTIIGLAATTDGGVVAVGSYSGTIDLDPGDAIESHQTMGFGHREAYVVKLAADGSFAWGGTFAGQGIDAEGDVGGVALDGAGGVYVAGSYAGEVDLDPGAGVEVHSSRWPATGEAISTGMLLKLTPAGQLSWLETPDTGACVLAAGSITLASDGAIWTVGGAPQGSCPDGSIIASYGPDGAPRGTWAMGNSIDSSTSPRSIAPGPNGSVYIGGSAWGLPDFDPGPGVARRFAGGLSSPGGGFIVKLASDGTYLWDQTVVDGEVLAVAGTPDGGVIGLGTLGVTKLNADGTAGWTFSSGTFPGTVVSSGTNFVVTGSNGNESDMDPGRGVDVVGDLTLYLSRFNF